MHIDRPKGSDSLQQHDHISFFINPKIFFHSTKTKALHIEVATCRPIIPLEMHVSYQVHKDRQILFLQRTWVYAGV